MNIEYFIIIIDIIIRKYMRIESVLEIVLLKEELFKELFLRKFLLIR